MQFKRTGALLAFALAGCAPAVIVADLTSSLALAFMLPMACYAIIAAFGFYARRPA